MYIKISEGCSLAMHVMAYLASEDNRIASVREMAELLRASQNHLHKVCQQLVNAGLIRSLRGPGGGFMLNCPPAEVSLREIYRAFERSGDNPTCMFAHPVCAGGGYVEQCIFGKAMANINVRIGYYLDHTMLADISASCDENLGVQGQNYRPGEARLEIISIHDEDISDDDLEPDPQGGTP